MEAEATAEAIRKGHADPASLRQLLIATTSTKTADMAEAYFRNNLDDEELLKTLVEIALEGEDMGDAPWAAANTIVEFPASMLRAHEASLQKLSQEQWIYLSGPANKALAKISSL